MRITICDDSSTVLDVVDINESAAVDALVTASQGHVITAGMIERRAMAWLHEAIESARDELARRFRIRLDERGVIHK